MPLRACVLLAMLSIAAAPPYPSPEPPMAAHAAGEAEIKALEARINKFSLIADGWRSKRPGDVRDGMLRAFDGLISDLRRELDRVKKLKR